MVCFIDVDGWGVSPRGAGYLFGHDVVSEVSTILFVLVVIFCGCVV